MINKIKKNLNCNVKYKKGCCYKTCIRNLQDDINHLINLEKEINAKLAKFKTLKSNKIDICKLISIDEKIERINQKNFIPSLYRKDGYKDCKYIPDECESIFNLKNDEYKNYVKCLKNKIDAINKYIDVVFDIKKYLKITKLNNYEKIYVKFTEDRNSEPICLIYDLSSFNVKNKIMPCLYVFFGGYNKPGCKKLHMDLEYNNYDGTIKVVDIISKKPCCGHATFALKNLNNIICEINKIISKFNNEIKHEELKVKKITRVIGMIGPDTSLMTSKQLVEFYKKRGYYNNNSFGKLIT